MLGLGDGTRIIGGLTCSDDVVAVIMVASSCSRAVLLPTLIVSMDFNWVMRPCNELTSFGSIFDGSLSSLKTRLLASNNSQISLASTQLSRIESRRFADSLSL